MDPIDITILVLYFAFVTGVGFWYQRRAARDLESYFLGGKSMHWLTLAMSGAVSNFDISGTMWIVALISLFGMRSMWNHWVWGFLMGAFFMSFMGKWVRRSGVMTGAEWMVTRFGSGPAGTTARISYTIIAVVTLVGFLGYAFQGIGKFTSIFIDLGLEDPAASTRVAALGIFGIATLYVLLGGLYSLVITNVIQTILLTAAALIIAAVAYVNVSPDQLAEVLPADWTSLMPVWHWSDPASLPEAYAGYEWFGALVLVWVVKGLLLNLGGPGQMYDFQIFLAARNPRDAAKVGAAWSGFLLVRWAMTMGIALLAMTGIGSVEDPERVMPVVLDRFLWPGVRGFVIAGLFSAFLSTYGAVVNAAASYLVRDLWQPFFAPGASAKNLVRASYLATVGVVVAGVALGWNTESIRQIWDWIMIPLGGAFVIPNALRWYWWRLNGWGYSMGTLLGLAAGLIVPFVPSLSPLYICFPLVSLVSLVGCLAGTWLSRPTEDGVLVAFFRTVRPFGFWRPIRERSGLSEAELRDPSESAMIAAVNVTLAGAATLASYLAPMYLVAHYHTEAAISAVIATGLCGVLYFTWYRTLSPQSSDPSQ